jgi:hypothetical protein
MAIELDHKSQSVSISGVYWTLGTFTFDSFNEVAVIQVLPYLTEALRRQELTDEQKMLPPNERVLLHTPIQLPEIGVKTMKVPGDKFREYFTLTVPESGQTLVEAFKAAIWKYAKEQPEPFGLANHFKNGKDV